MSSGFPNRPPRSAFGPDPVDTIPVRDPERQLGAALGKLMLWQLSGMGLVVPRAMLVIDDTGTLISHAEAWDPKGLLAAPVVTNPAAGHILITYPATVPDDLGSTQTLEFVGATATVQGSTPHFASCELAVGLHAVDVYTWFHDGTADPVVVLVGIF